MIYETVKSRCIVTSVTLMYLSFNALISNLFHFMNIKLLNKYNKPAPRYTSYPPATFFHDDITSDNFKEMIKESNFHEPENISVYIHIPFCRQLCHFCGCNTYHYPDEEIVQSYISSIIKEIGQVTSLLDKSRPLTQIHWGGGTPNSINYGYIKDVMDVLREKFSFSENAEIAMECNPAYLELTDIDYLASIGFNRLSLGIQDFNTEVLKKANRKAPLSPVEKMINRMKANNMKGVNIDLMYGLPGQTTDSFKKTIEKIISIAPDRIVTFSYAHVPWIKPAQKILEKTGLPPAAEKLRMFEMAYKLLTANNYISVGMDHYAKKDDELSIALKNKKLSRNFQGYCTTETTGQVYGFGATSISQLNGGYYQNAKDVKEYIDAISQKDFATRRGYELNKNDVICRHIITQIMCNGFLDLNDTASQFQCTVEDIKKISGFSKEKLKPFIEDDLLKIENNVLQLKAGGFLVVRNIAMVFDPLHCQSKQQYSKTV